MAEPKPTNPQPPRKPAPVAPAPVETGERHSHPPAGARPAKDDAGRFIYETPAPPAHPRGPIGTDADGRNG